MSPPSQRRNTPTGAETFALDRFLQGLSGSGILSAAEVQSLSATTTTALRHDCRPLVQDLINRQTLTRYQATTILQGKAGELVLDNYVVLDKLGEGGMGTVFRARHRRLGQVVALKVLSAAVTAKPTAVKRFLREVRAVAQLHHPNIVAASDAGEDRGVHFLVMEFVAGTDLAKLVKKNGPLPVGQALNGIIQATRGLAHAHAAGIIHRDIKPSNLFLDHKGVVKVLDLGLARQDRPGCDDDSVTEELTQTGNILGTCDFMAPEQALNSKYADQRSDIYSLGCTLHYLLTGNTMYDGQTMMEKLLAHREAPIPPLPGASATLQAVYRRMVAKKPEERFASMDAVIAALEACQRPADRTLPARRRRRRILVAAALAGAAFLVALLFVMLGSSDRPTGEATEKTIVAKDTVRQVPAVAPTNLPVDDPARWRKAINLLPLIDPAKDAAHGKWRLEAVGLVSGGAAAAKLVIPYQPPDEYDFRIVFTRLEGDHAVAQILSKARRCFSWDMGVFPNKACTFNTVKGRANNNATTVLKDLTNGKRHTSIVQVRNTGLSAILDGILVKEYRTDYNDMGEPYPWKWPTPSCLGVGSWSNSTAFHAIEVLEMNGTGTFTRPAEPAVKETPRR